jgi:DNA-directed RNA polymerase subunit RPC12/RpoP
MADPPRRKILSLKNPPPLPAPPPAPVRAPEPQAPQGAWKCKPCGARLDVAADADPDSVVRCPACNANLGKAGQFLSDPPGKIRARRA